jgi:hypothetical protein
MITLRAPHQGVNSVPNLLVNQDCFFPRGDQYSTQAAIIESGIDPPSSGQVLFDV